MVALATSYVSLFSPSRAWLIKWDVTKHDRMAVKMAVNS